MCPKVSNLIGYRGTFPFTSSHIFIQSTGHQFVDTGTGFPIEVRSCGFWNYRKTHPICARFQPFWRDSGQNSPLPAYWQDSIVKKKKKKTGNVCKVDN
jgi:hypothetical protein